MSSPSISKGSRENLEKGLWKRVDKEPWPHHVARHVAFEKMVDSMVKEAPLLCRNKSDARDLLTPALFYSDLLPSGDREPASTSSQAPLAPSGPTSVDENQ
jgi:hypothetical protein